MKMSEAAEQIREHLVWLAEFIHKKYGLGFNEIRRLVKEMLSVSI